MSVVDKLDVFDNMMGPMTLKILYSYMNPNLKTEFSYNFQVILLALYVRVVIGGLGGLSLALYIRVVTGGLGGLFLALYVIVVTGGLFSGHCISGLLKVIGRAIFALRYSRKKSIFFTLL